MKALFGTLMFSCVLQASLMAQSGFYSGEQLYVWSKTGLSLRKAPAQKAVKIKNLPYGTKVVVEEKGDLGSSDSVMVIPSVTNQEGRKTPDLFLRGFWTRVVSGQDTGYVFGGYLSSMAPFKPPPPSEINSGSGPEQSISGWLTQTAGILDTRKVFKSDDDYTRVYKNHVVEFYHASEGSGIARYTFQHGMNFQDGFLLLNYFENLHISKAEIAACESFDLAITSEYLQLLTYGFRGGIVNIIRLSWKDGLLIIEVGGGC